MTSSPIPAARSQYLLDLLAQVPDPRKRRGCRIAGGAARRRDRGGDRGVEVVRRDRAVGRRCQPGRCWPGWARHAARRRSPPSGARSPGSAPTCSTGFPAPGCTPGPCGRAVAVIAIDGKTVRGAKNKAGKAPHLVAALAHGIGAVLGQVAVDEKSNEIPAVRELLKAFADLAAAVITIDAMHTQHDTAQVILGRGADYVMTVKANMPTLYRKLKNLPWAAVPAVSSVSTDHGRRARRTIKVALAPTWIEFAGAAQVAQLRRTVTKKGKKTVEVVYLITSDRDADPVTLAAWVRSHWHIENKLHRASKTLRRSATLRPRCGYGPRACWAWRQRLSC